MTRQRLRLSRLLPLLLIAGLACNGSVSEQRPAGDREADDVAPPTAAPDASTAPDTHDPGDPHPVRVALSRVGTTRFTKPVQVIPHGGELYVAEQEGLLKLLAADGASATTALDLSDRVAEGSELGLLSMTLHPNFEDNGWAYVYYTTELENRPGAWATSIVSRFTTLDGGASFDPASEKVIIEVIQPADSHNGGTVAFGNDGYLYWSLGDGAYGFDPYETAQNTNDLLGSIVRIDVDNGDPYAIPQDNPHVAGGGRPEIYAIGLRNPFRFSFDRLTGDLWLGDVGEEQHEEINKITLGGNYGWPIREGKTCLGAETCDSTGLIDPIVDHPHTEAQSITGGVVYRGSGVPSLTGKYVYGDFISGALFALSPDDAASVRLEDMQTTPRPSSFALDAAGEIVLSSYDGFLYRITPGAEPTLESSSSTGSRGRTTARVTRTP